MFREMRRQDRKIDDSEAIRILEEGQYGVLSTTGCNGYAYGVPLSYTYSNGSIYFHCASEGQKLDNIRHNNRVSFCVTGATELLPEKFSTKYESAVVFGKAFEVNGDEKQEALVSILKKYSPGFMEKGMKYLHSDMSKAAVIKVEIEHISGKARRN